MKFYLINDGHFRVTEQTVNSSSLLACRQLLIHTDDENILIDTGIGSKIYREHYFNKFNIKQPRQLEQSLSIAGITPEKITRVILTHLHFDHVGGCSSLDDSGCLKNVFTNAGILVQKLEYDYALVQSRLGVSSYVENNLSLFRDNSKITFLEGDVKIDELNLMLVGGHTPGLQIVRFSDKEQIYYFASDLIPTPFHINQNFNPPGIDYNQEQTRTAKIKLLDRVIDERAVILFSHAPSVAAVRVVSKENGKYAFRSAKLDSSF